MRSDGFDEETQQANWKARNLAPVSVEMEDDLRHARYWNKKLYECEANMPDRSECLPMSLIRSPFVHVVLSQEKNEFR